MGAVFAEDEREVRIEVPQPGGAQGDVPLLSTSTLHRPALLVMGDSAVARRRKERERERDGEGGPRDALRDRATAT